MLVLWVTGSLDLTVTGTPVMTASAWGKNTHPFWSDTTFEEAAAFLASSLTAVGRIRYTKAFLTPLVPESTTSRSERIGASLAQSSGFLTALPFSCKTWGGGGSPLKTTRPLSVPHPSALTAAVGAVPLAGAVEVVAVPGAGAAEGAAVVGSLALGEGT